MRKQPEDIETPDDTGPPRWIDPLLTVAALLALAAAIAALWSGWGQGSPHQGTIADITVNLGGQPVREHCTTCHTEGGRTRSHEGTWVSAPHPDIAPHSLERLGCTGCHLGEGMALDRTISHGLPGLGARQVLTGTEVQGRCFACHPVAPLPGAENAWAGYQLFRRQACDLCHHLDGLTGRFGYGPDLSALGSQLGLSQIAEAIREPAKKPGNSIMPRFPLSRGQVSKLAYFLKSRVAEPLTTSPLWVAAGRPELPAVPMTPAGKELPPGADLLWRGGCLACHRFAPDDGRIAPDLTVIGSMRSRDYLDEFLEHPARLIPGAIMPPSNLNPKERGELVAFLAAAETGETHHLQSKQVYMHLCQRCHAANGDGKGMIQPNLANFPRAFAGNPGFFSRAPDDRLRDSIARGIPGTSMPPYEKVLPAEVRDQLLDLIFQSFIGAGRQEKTELLPLPERAEPLSARQEDDLFADFCVRCHGRTGTGKGPDADKFLPRPRNLTNTPYFSGREDQQILRAILDGVPGTAMSAWRTALKGDEAWALVNKVRRLSKGNP